MNGPVLLYDGTCILCSRGVRYVLQYEKKPLIRFVTIQSREGADLAKAHDIKPTDPATFLFVENGKALKKSTAALAVLKHVGGPARIFSLGAVLPLSLRDAVYNILARNRFKWFGRSDVCIMPDTKTRHRFVLPESMS
jgi:predicted DCC family thiol-disulfide oxidoreductase YuxK